MLFHKSYWNNNKNFVCDSNDTPRHNTIDISCTNTQTSIALEQLLRCDIQRQKERQFKGFISTMETAVQVIRALIEFLYVSAD